MLDLLKQKARMTETENGAVTYEISGSECLDLFASIGAFRHAGDEEIINCFIRAYTENADLAMKILFYARRHKRRPGGTSCISHHPLMACEK